MAAGTYPEGLIIIDKDLTIVGDDTSKPVITPTEDTGTSGNEKGWFRIKDANVNFENLVFDGTGQAIWAAIIYQEEVSTGGTVENCDILNIRYSQYKGRGMGIYGTYVEVLGCTFTNIERVGILTYKVGDTTTALIKGCTYTGKGDGDWLDYAFEVSAGASAIIEDNTVTDCHGEGSGWSSAGIYVHGKFAPGTSATITDNTISGSKYGIVIGYGESDTSVVVANYNNIAGNDYGLKSTGPQVDATCNWWGHASGPSGPDGRVNNKGKIIGKGDAILGNVDWDPWLPQPIRHTKHDPVPPGLFN